MFFGITTHFIEMPNLSFMALMGISFHFNNYVIYY